MTATQSADIFGFKKITKKSLLESCKKNKLYRTPGLNDVLYLHYQGYEDIESLEEYTGLKCIWLECNAISKISGLDNQKLLKCLFLHNNVIKKIENLEFCPELDTINLSHNHIVKIENCGFDKLPVLTSLNLSHNYIRTYDGLVNLIDCKTLSVLDLANNRIEDILCIKIFAQMPELRVLVLQGNPVVNQIPQYRKTLILDCLNLTYLDSRPVFPRDRACAEAWKQGGYEAERIEHARWNREERKKIRHSVNATLRLKNRGGGDPQPQLLMSSDDEDAGITELSSAPSLEKDQMVKEDISSKLLKSSDDEDSDNNDIRSISLFKMSKENIHANTLFNTEVRCIVCTRLNCTDEHLKKKKRIRNDEEPETILENSFIFNGTEEYNTDTINNNNDIDNENNLYNDVYVKNIQYINEAVATSELKKKEEDNLNNIVSNTITSNDQSKEKKSIGTNTSSIEENKTNKSDNLSQVLVRNHEQDNDITELDSAPPMKKCKLNIHDDFPCNSNDESFSIYSQSNSSEEPIKKLQEEIAFNSTDELILDNMKDNSEIVNEPITDEATLEIDSIERKDAILSETDLGNTETNNSISDMESKSLIKYDPNINSYDNNIERIENDAGISIENLEKKVQQLIDFSTSLNLINELPAVFSSKLFLGTDTNINSAIALYEMHHRNDYNSENDSDEFEMPIIKKENKELITIDKDIEHETIKSKMEIISRLLKDPLTKTFNYDSSKINEEFEILKNNDTETNNTRLKTFIENESSETEINNDAHSIHVSKSEEIILKNSLKTDDEGKNSVETHSSDTRILKIQYNI